MSEWIVVRNWEKFQHYKDRNPLWIKTYLDLLDRDEYLDLNAGARSLLHGLWLLTAKRHASVALSTRKLSAALGLRVTEQQVEALVDAGFIRISASKSVPIRTKVLPQRQRKREKESAQAREGKSNGIPEGQSPYAMHSKKPRLKAAEAWAKNGLLLEVPAEDRVRVLRDEFNLTKKDADRLAKSVAL